MVSYKIQQYLDEIVAHIENEMSFTEPDEDNNIYLAGTQSSWDFLKKKISEILEDKP